MDWKIDKQVWILEELPVFTDHNDNQKTSIVMYPGDGPDHAIDEFEDDKDVWLLLENLGWIQAKYSRKWRVTFDNPKEA